MDSQEEIFASRFEVLRGMSDFVAENLSLLAPIDKAWQPTDYLPDLTKDGWIEKVTGLRDACNNLSDEILVILVGDMITEEALPSYSVALKGLVPFEAENSPAPWGQWVRGWTAEENRHGDLLNAYLRLTGRVDMRAIELTIHYLLRRGFDPKTSGDPYGGLIYTAFQERATRISHANVGQIALKQGDTSLGRICSRIAGDEARHEAFYTKSMGKVFDQDPQGAMLSCLSMLKGLIAMPGRQMFDGKDPNLFDHFAAVAQRTEVYTVDDYSQIIEHLMTTWNVAGRSVSGKAARAQDYLCKQAERYAQLAEPIRQALAEQPRVAFSWIYDRCA